MSSMATLFGPDVQVDAEDLQIARFEPFTTVAWPGRISAAVVTQGCPLRCSYCNACAYQDPREPGRVSWAAVRSHLARPDSRVNSLVLTGGEPLRQPQVVPAMQEARAMGLAVTLETAGVFPRRLAEALPFTDRLALDIKAAPAAYGDLTGKPGAGPKAWESLKVAVAWGGDLEVRLTVDPVHHTASDVYAVVDAVLATGAPAPVLQEVSLGGTTADYARLLAGQRLGDVLGENELAALDARGVAVRREGAPRA